MMPAIPPSVLKKLYVKGSLRAQGQGFVLELKNLVAPATITGFNGLDLDGRAVDVARVRIESSSGKSRPISEVSRERPLDFPIGATVTVRVADEALEPGQHELAIRVDVKEVGSLAIPVSDDLA